MKNLTYNEIKKEYFSFKNEINKQIKDKNISSNSAYLINDIWDKDLNQILEKYEKKSKMQNNDNICNDIILLNKGPEFINNISSAIDCFKKNYRLILISKNLMISIYGNCFLNYYNTINYYAGYNNLIIEYKENDFNYILLIINPFQMTFKNYYSFIIAFKNKEYNKLDLNKLLCLNINENLLEKIKNNNVIYKFFDENIDMNNFFIFFDGIFKVKYNEKESFNNLNENNNIINKYEKKINELKNELEKKDKEIAELKNENNNLEINNIEKNKEINEIKINNKKQITINNELNEIKKDNQELNKKYNDLLEEKKNLEKEIKKNKLLSDINNINKEENDIVKLQKDNLDYKNKLNDLIEKNKNQENQIIQLTSIEKKYNDIENKLKNKEKELIQLNEENKNQKKDLINNKNKLEEFQKEINEIKIQENTKENNYKIELEKINKENKK